MRNTASVVIVLLGSIAFSQIRSISKPPPPPPAGKGVVEGTVTNGITHEPIKRAQVGLSGPVRQSAVTDHSGHFAFKDLPAGQYFLQASASNFSSRSSHPSPSFRQIKLDDDGKMSDINLSLVPNGSIHGQVMDEDGVPLANCSVSLVFSEQNGFIRSDFRYFAQTDDAGEYHLPNVVPATYRALVRCQSWKPLPHAFIERGPDVDIPQQTYAPQLYPGASDMNGASAIVVSAGVDVGGIDFRVSPIIGLNVRGHVASAQLEGLQQRVQVRLDARDPARRELLQYYAGLDRTGKFRFSNVVPASYNLTAITYGESPIYYARLTVDVGATPVQPLEVTLAPVASVSGTVTFDDDKQTIPDGRLQVLMEPIENNLHDASNAMVQKDRTFVLPDVIPGKWRLRVSGAAGYLKSVFLNEQEVSSGDIEISQGAVGKLKIVIGTKWPQVEGNASAASSGTEPITGVLWPVDDDFASFSPRFFSIDAQKHFTVGYIVPGHYVACAFAGSDASSLLSDEALRKKIAGQCTTFQAAAGEKTVLDLNVIKDY